MADPRPASPRARLPRVPAYAWSWLQRSRPVVDELARRLTGQAPTPQFLDGVREGFATDPFVQDVVVDVVAEVAFNGRQPQRRPPGTAWDRGLTWWAATIAGTTPQDFEARSAAPAGAQRALFDTPHSHERVHPRTGPVAAVPRSPVANGRAALAAALRELLASAEGDQVPASAVRQLLGELEGR